jgi:hypothetical protein
MRRAYAAPLIGVAVLFFLAVSALLARVLSIDGAERSAITAVVEAEARGDQNGMLERLLGCRAKPACRERVTADVVALARPGSVSILTLQPSAGFSLGSTVGTARVAWKVGSSLPIVQCVRVRRAGDALSGLHVELLEISARIKTDAGPAPARALVDAPAAADAREGDERPAAARAPGVHRAAERRHAADRAALAPGADHRPSRRLSPSPMGVVGGRACPGTRGSSAPQRTPAPTGGSRRSRASAVPRQTCCKR